MFSDVIPFTITQHYLIYIFLGQNRTLLSCPDGYYEKNMEEVEESMNYTCGLCHYTCKTCNGSLDYDCLTCFPDAVLTNQSPSENYCYPISISWIIHVHSMYTMFFVILFVLMTLLFIGILWLLWKLRKQNRYNNLKSHVLGLLDKEQM